MGSTCKLCGVGLMARWCQRALCWRFVQVPVAALQDFRLFEDFYLDHKEVFNKTSKAGRCDECDQVLALKGLTNPCPDCLKNEPDRTYQWDAGAEVGREWEGYNLELLGILLGRWSKLEFSPERSEYYERIGAIVCNPEGKGYVRPSLLLSFTCIPDSVDPDLIIKLCRVRARYKDSPLYSEMGPYRYGVRRVSIHGLEYRHTNRDRDKAFKGLDLLRAAQNKLGRKKGTRFYSKTDFCKAAPLAYRDFYSRLREHPTSSQLAIEMYLSRSAFFDHLQDYNLTMNGIRASAMEQIKLTA